MLYLRSHPGTHGCRLVVCSSHIAYKSDTCVRSGGPARSSSIGKGKVGRDPVAPREFVEAVAFVSWMGKQVLDSAALEYDGNCQADQSAVIGFIDGFSNVRSGTKFRLPVPWVRYDYLD